MLASAAGTPAELDGMVDQRVAGMPLEYILGWAEFCGLRVVVDHRVFVPRIRTEFLVRQAAGLARPGAVVVDLCCGSGAVGAALVAALERIELHAVQQPLSAAALEDVMGVPAWRGLPSWYMVADGDQAIPPDAERLFASAWVRPPSRSRRTTWPWSPTPMRW